MLTCLRYYQRLKKDICAGQDFTFIILSRVIWISAYFWQLITKCLFHIQFLVIFSEIPLSCSSIHCYVKVPFPLPIRKPCVADRKPHIKAYQRVEVSWSWTHLNMPVMALSICYLHSHKFPEFDSINLGPKVSFTQGVFQK